MENGFLKKAKQGLMGFRELKIKSGLRELILSKSRFWERKGGEKEEKLGQSEKIKIVGVISSHFLLLSDQASWVKKIQRD